MKKRSRGQKTAFTGRRVSDFGRKAVVVAAGSGSEELMLVIAKEIARKGKLLRGEHS